MNPYKVLGVGEDATQEDIKNAYRRLSKKNHPDTGGDPKVFMNIKKAYETLSIQEQRDTYDMYGVSIDFMKEARELAFTVFLDVATQLEEGTPLDQELKVFISEGQIPKYELEMKEAESKKIRLQRRLFRIIKKPEDDFITQSSLDVIDRYNMDYKIALLQRDLYKKALELLETYKFDHLRLTDWLKPPAPRTVMGNFDLKNYIQGRNA